MKKRACGILHHITSLPSAFGIGDLGSQAYTFADFLAQAKQSYWQLLPLTPTDPLYGNSPYLSSSSCAQNPLLISPEFLVRDGLIKKSELEPLPAFPTSRIDYQAVADYKQRVYSLAYKRFREKKSVEEYEHFCEQSSVWLNDFSVFTALQTHFKGTTWDQWPVELRDRHPAALQSIQNRLHNTIERIKFLQFVFSQQWHNLKQYCNSKGIQLFGDIPIYVNYNSADVWTHPAIFKLGEDKKPLAVAGVPPDYFSETGQLWGNPLYRWDVLQQQGYSWWLNRIEHNFHLFDMLRIDHFRGLVAYWEVPVAETTAINGKWIEAPAEDFLTHLNKKFPHVPIIAEDLGIITQDVRNVMQQFEIPGMKVLLFAFDGNVATNPYVPHNVTPNSIIYTGTHDNNTVRGWFEHEATAEAKQHLFDYLGREPSAKELPWEFIRLAMMSVAAVAMIPTQDILGLGQEARMNIPSTSTGNWQWRVLPAQITPEHITNLRKLTELYGRANETVKSNE